MATHETRYDLGDRVHLPALDVDALIVQITLTFGRPKFCVRYWIDCRLFEEWVYECEIAGGVCNA